MPARPETTVVALVPFLLRGQLAVPDLFIDRLTWSFGHVLPTRVLHANGPYGEFAQGGSVYAGFSALRQWRRGE